MTDRSLFYLLEGSWPFYFSFPMLHLLSIWCPPLEWYMKLEILLMKVLIMLRFGSRSVSQAFYFLMNMFIIYRYFYSSHQSSFCMPEFNLQHNPFLHALLDSTNMIPLDFNSSIKFGSFCSESWVRQLLAYFIFCYYKGESGREKLNLETKLLQ